MEGLEREVVALQDEISALLETISTLRIEVAGENRKVRECVIKIAALRSKWEDREGLRNAIVSHMAEHYNRMVDLDGLTDAIIKWLKEG